MLSGSLFRHSRQFPSSKLPPLFQNWMRNCHIQPNFNKNMILFRHLYAETLNILTLTSGTQSSNSNHLSLTWPLNFFAPFSPLPTYTRPYPQTTPIPNYAGREIQWLFAENIHPHLQNVCQLFVSLPIIPTR